MKIRREATTDREGIRRVNEAAFARPTEAQLVDRLRDAGAVTLSLVAVTSDDAMSDDAMSVEVVGHVLFTPVVLQTAGLAAGLVGAGLGPVAVLPDFQKQGIGAALIEAGLARCRADGLPYAVVLGHADYYPRFGFVPSVRYGIRSEFDVPDDVFMVQELVDGALTGRTGTIHYQPEFREAG